MAGVVAGNCSIKEALFEALSAVLSVDQDVRNTGEEQMKALEVTEGILLGSNMCVSTFWIVLSLAPALWGVPQFTAAAVVTSKFMTAARQGN